MPNDNLTFFECMTMQFLLCTLKDYLLILKFASKLNMKKSYGREFNQRGQTNNMLAF